MLTSFALKYNYKMQCNLYFVTCTVLAVVRYIIYIYYAHYTVLCLPKVLLFAVTMLPVERGSFTPITITIKRSINFY